jgi:hypothetical protein
MKTALQRLPLLGIVIVATGCDNVEWGGVQVGLRDPSESLVSGPPPPETAEAVADSVSEAPTLGPVLYLGHRAGNEAILVPVAEVRPGGLFPLERSGSVEASTSFTTDYLTPGLEFTLFSDGAQVGTLSAERFSVDERYCRVRPQIRGSIELVPAARAVQTFLAVPTRESSAFASTVYSPVGHTSELLVTSTTTMRQFINSIGARSPGNVLDIRQDVQMFRARPGAAPTVVATFVLGDDLVVGPVSGGTYSVFLASDDDDGTGYERTYLDYRLASEDGKGAARYFDHLDVDGDGTDEIVLEVLGEESMWLSILRRREGSWVEEYRDPCGLPSRSSGPAR